MSLGTDSPIKDFENDFSRYGQALYRYANKHLVESQMLNRDAKVDAGDEDVLLQGYALHASALKIILDQMVEAESMLTDDAEDEAEVQHGYGEIFALKTAYLAIQKSFDPLQRKYLEFRSKNGKYGLQGSKGLFFSSGGWETPYAGKFPTNYVGSPSYYSSYTGAYPYSLYAKIDAKSVNFGGNPV